MGRKTKGDDGVLLTIVLELGGEVAFVAVENDYAIYACPPGFCILVEVLNPVQACLIVCPAVWRSFDPLSVGNTGLGVRRGKVMLPLKDQVRGHHKTVATDVLDYCRPFPIAGLKILASAFSIGTSDDYSAANNAYHEACLVEVVKVPLLDRVLRPYVIN